jgi:hypothetical protein
VSRLTGGSGFVLCCAVLAVQDGIDCMVPEMVRQRAALAVARDGHFIRPLAACQLYAHSTAPFVLAVSASKCAVLPAPCIRRRALSAAAPANDRAPRAGRTAAFDPFDRLRCISSSSL